MIHTDGKPTIAQKAADEILRFDSIDAIIRFEQGELDEDETIELFQYLVTTGLAWKLQGSYGRTAQYMIEAGHITL